MGVFSIKVRIANLQKPARSLAIDALVDTGAVFPMLPAKALRSIGVRPLEKMRFQLANGHTMTREVGEAMFFIDGRRGPSKVIFGQKNDPPILGALALEAMALEVDPLRKRLKPMKLLVYLCRCAGTDCGA